jgi:signal transduction histidine kinase
MAALPAYFGRFFERFRKGSGSRGLVEFADFADPTTSQADVARFLFADQTHFAQAILRKLTDSRDPERCFPMVAAVDPILKHLMLRLRYVRSATPAVGETEETFLDPIVACLRGARLEDDDRFFLPHAVEQAVGMVANRLAFLSRTDTGLIENISVGLIRPAAFINNVVDCHRDAAHPRIDFRITGGFSHTILVDRCRWLSLFDNILWNAEAAIAEARCQRWIEHGIVSFRIATERLADEDWLTFTVKDNGCGMTVSKLETLVSSQSPAVFSGHGVGFWLIRSIVRLQRGRLVIESEPGVGTKIKVLFPLKGIVRISE